MMFPRGGERWRGAAVAAVLLLASVAAAEDGRDAAVVPDGEAISPEFAQMLFDRVAALRAADGCRLARFDTTRFRMAIAWTTAAGAERLIEIATATGPAGGATRRVGSWTLAVPDGMARDCPQTLARLEELLAATDAPARRLAFDRVTVVRTNQRLLTTSFVLLLLGSAAVMMRELRRQRPPLGAVLALTGIWAATLAAQLALSPRTFLHEYYHVAETISAYLGGSNPPGYGDAGPVLFRLAAALSGRPDDVAVIFLTNAVLSSLAIPAIALLDLALFAHWPRALTAAVLLGAMPLHLRYAAAEDLFVTLLTFTLWSAALAMSYARSGRLLDALLAALALSLAAQMRPEGIFVPAAVLALVLLCAPAAWRRLVDWRALLALALLAALLVPRLVDLAAAAGTAPAPAVPALDRYLRHLVLFDAAVTPTVYVALLAAGALWTAVRRPSLLLWVAGVYVAYTLFALSMFDNPPYNLRSQVLPTGVTALLAAGVAPLGVRLWGGRPAAPLAGAVALAGVAAIEVAAGRAFITELRDQQLQWAFLERTVPTLPDRGRLLAPVDAGGHRLDTFPDLLLRRAGKHYALIDVRRAAAGEVDWPRPDDDLLWYQGMFCYFAFAEEDVPRPLSSPCRAVHERYDLEPVAVTELDTTGFSLLVYAPPPYRIGFFRLRPRAATPDGGSPAAAGQ
jgi:hypothetical protein